MVLEKGKMGKEEMVESKFLQSHPSSLLLFIYITVFAMRLNPLCKLNIPPPNSILAFLSILPFISLTFSLHVPSYTCACRASFSLGRDLYILILVGILQFWILCWFLQRDTECTKRYKNALRFKFHKIIRTWDSISCVIRNFLFLYWLILLRNFVAGRLNRGESESSREEKRTDWLFD